jgi:eukaryotic-like serine/threonine-protein kinase
MTDANPGLMTLFAEALERTDPADRAAYLERACAGDAALRGRIEALLAAHDGAGRFLEPDATGVVEPTPAETLQGTQTSAPEASPVPGVSALETPPSTLGLSGELGTDGTTAGPVSTAGDDRPGSFVPGQVVAGRYTLLEILGEGGMGAVYRAEQFQPVRRQVALKLIKTGMDWRVVLARFDAERQALALMDHPNIARVYDGGATEANQPFFVMELVNGVSITEYCDQHRLPVRARLELFVAVCQAVQHAHQKGIIHRDLKPSNVLIAEVDGRPTPKVIDFGVAKATEFDLTDQSLGDTGAIVGTPTYMSPEQADPSSMDIDTRTDVYALGVILYELLVGSPPIDAKQFKRGALREMLRMVREVDPPNPSTKVSTSDALPSIAASRSIDPSQLKRALTGDLDWIVMKALEKDRTRRYETANGFAADVMRHIASEPVVAAPPSRVYRLGKFVRKHRAGVIAASLVLLALLAGMAGTTWRLIREAKANASLAAKNGELTVANARVTEANADLGAANAKVEARYNLAVDAIKTFHTGVSEDFLLKEEKFKDLRDRLLKSAADFYGKLGALLGKETDPASRRALAASNFELAGLTDKVGRKEDAIAAHRAVLAAREALAAEPGADAGATADVGRSLNALALLLHTMGRSDEALVTYRRSESLLANAAESDPAVRAELADCRSRLGYLLATRGKKAEALATYWLARSDQETLAAAPGAAKEIRRDLSETVLRIGFLLAGTGKPSEAEAEFRRAISLKQRLADDNPAVPEFRSGLALSHFGFGGTLERTGETSEAEAEFRSAIALFQRLADDNPAVTDFQNRLALGHGGLGYILMRTGKPTEAEAAYRSAIALYRKLAEDNPAATDYRSFLANSHNGLGYLLERTGKPTEAEAQHRSAIALYRKLAENDTGDTGFRNSLVLSHVSLGSVLLRSGKLTEAEADYRSAIALLHRLVGDDPADTDDRRFLAISNMSLGSVLLRSGKPAEAVALLRSAGAVMERLATVAAVDLYNLACNQALVAVAAGVRGSGLSAAEAPVWADRAMNTLRRAAAAGFRDTAHMQTDTDLDPLRGREDFQLLMMDLAMPTEPFAKGP